MAEENNNTPYALINQAIIEAKKRNKDRVRELIDEAIKITPNKNAAMSLYVLRERLLMESRDDLPNLMAALRAQLNFYGEVGHITGQVDTLRNLATIAAQMQDRSGSLAFLDTAEQTLQRLQDNDLKQICSEIGAKDLVAAREFVRTRTSMLSRLKAGINRTEE